MKNIHYKSGWDNFWFLVLFSDGVLFTDFVLFTSIFLKMNCFCGHLLYSTLRTVITCSAKEGLCDFEHGFV